MAMPGDNSRVDAKITATEIDPLAIGQSVPREVTVVYLNDIKHAAQGVAGFSLEDLNSLCQVFFARKFDRNTKLVEAGSAATYFFILLSGSAQVTREVSSKHFEVVDTLSCGDMMGHNMYFDKQDCTPVHTHSCTMTGMVNVVLICKFTQLTKLNLIDPALGLQMVRLVAEAACNRMFSPCSAPMDLDTLQRTDNVQELKHMVKKTHTDPTLFADMSEQDVDVVLGMGGVVRFRPGQLIFLAGHSCRAILMLLQGQVEVRQVSGEYLHTLSKPGEVLGEAVLQNIVHRGNSYALTEVVLLGFSMDTLRSINKTHPKIGIQLFRNVVRTTMQKIRRVFRSRGMVYDPERMDASKLEQENAELRKLTSEGLQRVLRSATSCLTGQDPNQIGDQVRMYSGASALDKLVDIQKQLADRLNKKDEELKASVPKQELDKAKIASEKLRSVELELRKEIRDLNTEANKMNESMAELEAQMAEKDKVISAKDEEIAQAKEALRKERENVRDLLRRVRERDEPQSVKHRLGRNTDDDVTQIIINRQKELLEEKDARIQREREASSKLEYDLRELRLQCKRYEAQARLPRKSEASSSDGCFLDDDALVDEDGRRISVSMLEDEMLVKMQRDLETEMWERASVKWSLLVQKCLAKQAVLTLCSEYVTKVKQCKSIVKQYEDLEETCQTLRRANVNLMGEVDVMNKKLRSNPKTEHSDKDEDEGEAPRTARDVAHAREVSLFAQLVCWYVVTIFRLEDRAGRYLMKWVRSKIDLLESVWDIMFSKNLLIPAAKELDLHHLLKVRKAASVAAPGASGRTGGLGRPSSVQQKETSQSVNLPRRLNNPRSTYHAGDLRAPLPNSVSSTSVSRLSSLEDARVPLPAASTNSATQSLSQGVGGGKMPHGISRRHSADTMALGADSVHQAAMARVRILKTHDDEDDSDGEDEQGNKHVRPRTPHGLGPSRVYEHEEDNSQLGRRFTMDGTRPPREGAVCTPLQQHVGSRPEPSHCTVRLHGATSTPLHHSSSGGARLDQSRGGAGRSREVGSGDVPRIVSRRRSLDIESAPWSPSVPHHEHQSAYDGMLPEISAQGSDGDSHMHRRSTNANNFF